MILVDTSVWIDHLRARNTTMNDRLLSGNVLTHSMVIGELACGNLPDRRTRMSELRALPRITELDSYSVLSVIEERQLMGRGIGFVDAHLISAVLQHDGARLWTHDRRLNRVATDLGVAFVQNDGPTAGNGGES